MIKSARLQLRSPEPADGERYFSWVNDSETNLWRGLYHPTSLEAARAWVTTQSKSDAGSLTLAIETAEGETLGFIGLPGICARSRRAEIWIYIGAKQRWGMGFTTEAIRSLCKYAFEEMNLHRIWLECDPEFIAAVRCYEKVGFQREGLLRDSYYRRGQFRNSCIMGLLRNELGS